MSSNPECPFCHRSDWPPGPKFNGHKSYCKQHPESRKAPDTKPVPKRVALSDIPSTASTATQTATVSTTASSSSATLQPVTFTFSEGERLPSQQEIPEFKTPEQQKEEAKKGAEPTAKATLAEERKAGVSAIAALIIPLFDMANSALAGESLQLDKDRMKLNAQDAEMLAQAIILVDEKHGGPISKTLGSEEYGAEIFLAGVCIGLGIKVTMMLRMRQQRKPMRPSAAPSPEEIPRKNPLEQAADNIRNLLTPSKKKEENKEEEEAKPEGAMSGDKFMEYAKDYQDKAIVH